MSVKDESKVDGEDGAEVETSDKKDEADTADKDENIDDATVKDESDTDVDEKADDVVNDRDVADRIGFNGDVDSDDV